MGKSEALLRGGQAAQALEPAALVALQLLAPGGRAALVGDPRQLPATLLSRAAAAPTLAPSISSGPLGGRRRAARPAV